MAFAVQVNVRLLDAISPKLKGIERQFGKLGSAVDRSSEKLKKLGGALTGVGKKLSLGLTLPIALAGAASLKAAISAEETRSKFEIVFSKIGESADKMAKELSGSYGLSIRESEGFLASTADLLTGFGFTQDSALDLSSQVQKLAVDLGSLNQLPVAQASQALTSAILGEAEAAKSLGIVINEEGIKKKIAALEASGRLTDETNVQKKAIAVLSIAVEQSGNSIDNYSRTQGSAANRTKEFLARLDDLIVKMGKVLLPIYTKIVEVSTVLINSFGSLSDGTIVFIVVIAALAAALGPLLLALGGAIFVLNLFSTANLLAARSTLAMAAGLLKKVIPSLVGYAATMISTAVPATAAFATALLATGIPEVIIGITLLIGAIVLLARNFNSIMDSIVGFMRPVLGMIDSMLDRLEKFFPTLAKLGRILKDFVIARIKELLGFLKSIAAFVNKIIDKVADFTGFGGPEAASGQKPEGVVRTGPGGTKIINKIGIAARFDAEGNMIAARVVDEGQSTTTIESIPVGQVTSVII